MTPQAWEPIIRAIISATEQPPASVAQTPPPLLTKGELCDELRISLSTLDRHIGDGMPCTRIGRQYRFDLGEVRAWYRGRASDVVTVGGRAVTL